MKTATILEELAGLDSSRFAERYSSLGRRNAVLDYRKDYCVVPDLFPIVEGHSLLVTREFEINLLAGLAEKNRHQQVSQLFQAAAAQLCIEEEVMLFFEHGVAYDSVHTVCGTIHAHVHLMPMAAGDAHRVASTVSRNLNLKAIPNSEMGLRGDYIGLGVFRRNSCDLTFSSWSSEAIPSQAVRKIVGELVSEEWDWKKRADEFQMEKPIASRGEFRFNVELDVDYEKSFYLRESCSRGAEFKPHEYIGNPTIRSSNRRAEYPCRAGSVPSGF